VSKGVRVSKIVRLPSLANQVRVKARKIARLPSVNQVRVKVVRVKVTRLASLLRTRVTKVARNLDQAKL